jgi:glycosyltransferase involved in cell wall biosynthesis
MACGTPVVSFDNTSLPEVVGDAGLLVPDGDVAAFATAVRQVLDDVQVATELRLAGVARARAFPWSASVELHCGIYHAVGAE